MTEAYLELLEMSSFETLTVQELNTHLRNLIDLINQNPESLPLKILRGKVLQAQFQKQLETLICNI